MTTNTATVTAEDRQALEAVVEQMLEDQQKVAENAGNYENAAVTASATVGPTGANVQGWITYTRPGGPKIVL